MSSQTFQAAAEEIRRLMSSKTEVSAAYIFGSTVSGRARPDSDVDVAVLLESSFMKRLPLKYRADLTVDVGAALKTFHADVVILNDAPPALAHQVITKGRLVFERSRSDRVAFQVRSLNLFLDLEPIHRVRLHYMKRRYLKDPRHG